MFFFSFFTIFSCFFVFSCLFVFFFFLPSPGASPGPEASLKHRFLLQKILILSHDSGERRRKKEERRKKKNEERAEKQVPFHNRTHKTFLLFLCVETPHSDRGQESCHSGQNSYIINSHVL